MFCTNCGADNSADDKFCTTCGAQLQGGPAAGGSASHSGNNTTAQQETAVMQTVDAAGTASTLPAFVPRTAGSVNARAAGDNGGTAIKPKRRMKKSTIILLAVFGVLIAGLVIAYFILLNT
ncbi:MAG: zinc ribbon domain-containing protein, partial [Scardovia wiggsiae]|nr:zinc ribbon domain-containing protein [Scardovia wiggsiae]